MLDRKVVQEFLDEKLQDCAIKLPPNVPLDILTEIFCRYVEDDYYEWLKDNFKSFFQRDAQGELDWDGIAKRMKNISPT